MNYYCSNCFSKSEYKFSKPKFCQECGTKISTDTVVKKTTNASLPQNDESSKTGDVEIKKTPKIIKKIEVDEFENEEDNSDQEYYCSDLHSIISSIKPGAGVSVEGYEKNKGISFGSLMQEASSSPSDSNEFKFQNFEFKKTREQVLEEFKAEASSTRRHIEIEE
jgi:hypothetical protein